MNVLSLFDGLSGGRESLKRAGIIINKYHSSEIDPYAIKIADKNYPEDTVNRLGDVTLWREWNISDIDLVIAGSPCQGFSSAGNNLNFNDPRSALFFEFVNILNHYKPKYFLLENVKMKKEHQNIISKLLGCEPISINSKLVSAQSRPRLYWTNIPGIKQPADKNILLKDVLEENVDKKYSLSEAKIQRVLNTKRGKGFFYNKSYAKTSTLIAGYYKQPTDGIYVDLGFKRRLTPTECEKLQTIPLNYTAGVSDSQRYKMLGNGWTIDVIAHIFKGLNDNN